MDWGKMWYYAAKVRLPDPPSQLIHHLFYDFVAQLVEQRTFNAWVLGSNPNEVISVT